MSYFLKITCCLICIYHYTAYSQDTLNPDIDSVYVFREEPFNEVVSDTIVQHHLQNDTTFYFKKTPNSLRILDASLYSISGPVTRWDKKDWLKAGGVVAGGVALSLLDKPVKNFFNKNQTKFSNSISDFGYHYGKPYTAAIAVSGFYLSGVLFKNEWARETSYVLASSYISSGVIQAFLKAAVGRARPNTGLDPYHFRPFDGNASFSSFPSGHTQIALVTSMVLARRVENPVLKTLFYSAAGVTMVSRMYNNAHWFTDVALGGAIIWFCTDTIIKRMEETKHARLYKKDKQIKWNLLPGYNGFTIIGTF